MNGEFEHLSDEELIELMDSKWAEFCDKDKLILGDMLEMERELGRREEQ